MLFGRYASRKDEAKYPTLWEGLRSAYCPSIQNPSGTTLYDLSGFNRHVSVGGTVDTSLLWDRSFGGQCLKFDGVDEFVDLGGGNFSGTDFTITCWVKVDGVNSSFPFSTRNGPSGSGYEILNGNAGDLTDFRARIQSTTGSVVQAAINIGSPSSNWIFLGLVIRDGSTKTVSMCLNSSRVDSTAWTGTTLPSHNLYIARRASNYGNLRVDDFRIYTRALSTVETNLLAMSRGIAYTQRPRRTYGSVATPTFNPSWARRQQLIGSGVY